MKTYYSFLDKVFAFTDDKGYDWYCDKCGVKMNNQYGFTATDDEWTCTECGHVNDVSDEYIILNPESKNFHKTEIYCMSDYEIEYFINEMKRYGYILSPKDVKISYKGYTLKEALDETISDLKNLYDIVKVIYEPRESESEENNE